MSELRLAVQEQMFPREMIQDGATLKEMFDLASGLGYAAIELRGQGDFALEERLPELREAKEQGVVMASNCVDMRHFIGAFNPYLQKDAVDNLKSQLSVMAEIGGPGACVVTPAAWGMFSRRLPPHEPPRDREGDIAVLTSALNELGAHAKQKGVVLAMEPLNRYEDHMLNTIGTVQYLINKFVHSDNREGLGVVLDTYHMNIEERDPWGAIALANKAIKHVQLGDNSRYQPGTGQLLWPKVLHSLWDINYKGYMALECRLVDPSLDPLEAHNSLRPDPPLSTAGTIAALEQAAEFMHEQWQSAA